MNKKGTSLMEIMIVIVVLGLIAAFAYTSLTGIVGNTSSKVDKSNAETLESVIQTAHDDGVLTIKNNKLFNEVTNRSYSGTGNSFYEDMTNYLQTRIEPTSPDAKNEHNDGSQIDTYKFWFYINNGDINIYYYNHEKERVIIHTFNLD